MKTISESLRRGNLRLGRRSLATLSFALTTTVLGAVLAEQPRREAPVLAPGRSVAANDQSSAISTNPANLGFLVSSELRWTWVKTGDGSPDPSRGHAFDLALALPAHIGTGIRLDFARPNAAAFPLNGVFPTAPMFPRNYTFFTWALGFAPTPGLAVGLSIAHASSDNPTLDDFTSWNAAATFRPSPYFAVAVVGRDLNQPSAPLHVQDRNVDIAIAVRPTGYRGFQIGLEDHYYDGTGEWIPRATLGIDVPYVGRLRGDVTTSDPTISGRKTYTATAGLEIGVGTTTIEGGGIFGSGVAGSSGAGFYMGASLSDYRSPGIPEGSYALKIRIENTPGVREHVRLLRGLWRAAADPEIKAVAFMLKAEPASSLAHAEELGDAIRLLRANGKKVVCHLEDAQGRSLYVCSQADRVVINPAGVVRFAGLKTQYMYYASLLSKLGIQAQFVRIGAHKTAPEAFTRNGPTDVAKSDYLDMLYEYDDVFTSDIGGGRRLTKQELHETFSHGPFVAKEAINARLVDGQAFDDELEKVVSETVGHNISLRDEPRARRAPTRFGARKGIALIYVEGDMVDGKSRDVPLLGNRLVGSYTIAKALKDARDDPHIAAVVMRIESPGGSSLAADVMWREAVITAKKKPLIVSMGSYAASGGYYIAAAGRTIFANPLTVTGSIGIFYGKADVSELLKKIGVSVDTYKTTPRADGESIYRPYAEDELRELELKVRQLYGVFIDRVAEGRKMSPEAVDAVGQGRVWSGREAAARHLVDHLGGIREALELARNLTDLPGDAPITELPVPETSLLDFALKLAGASDKDAAAAGLLPAQLADVARAMAPFTIYGGDEALARLEWVPIGEP
jgi:protease-4